MRVGTGFVAAVVCVSAFAHEVHAKPYKGAEVYGREAVLHGRIEARMRMARGGGVLTTLFLYKNGSEAADAFWEEIDVEIFGKDNARTWQSNIIYGQSRGSVEEEHQYPESLADAYHTYTVEWTPTSVTWLLDGAEVRSVSGPPVEALTSPQSIRFNLWISDSPAWAGEFEPTELPTYQFVNWVKYYRYEDGKFELDWADDFDTFDTTRWSKANWTFDGNLVDFSTANALVRDGTLVLALTPEGATVFAGEVPKDTDDSSSSGSSGASGKATSGASGKATSGSAMGSGRSGETGSSTGAAGRSGTSGMTVRAGTSGAAERSGASGVAGRSGTSGAAGRSGDVEDTGRSGGGQDDQEDTEDETSSGGGCAMTPHQAPVPWAFLLPLALVPVAARRVRRRRGL